MKISVKYAKDKEKDPCSTNISVLCPVVSLQFSCFETLCKDKDHRVPVAVRNVSAKNEIV